jgi:glycopeptide antibiotics resistance protein
VTATSETAPPRAAAAHAGRTGTLTVLFGVYLVLLVWTVLWKLGVPFVGDGAERVVKLVPLVATATTGASDPVEVAENLLVFVPFGLYLGLLAPSWAWWRAAGVVAATSLALEVGQYALAVGSSDVTDVVVNTAGGVVGLGLAALVRRRLAQRTTAVVTRICAIGTALALVAVALFLASPVRFTGPAPGDISHAPPMRGTAP